VGAPPPRNTRAPAISPLLLALINFVLLSPNLYGGQSALEVREAHGLRAYWANNAEPDFVRVRIPFDPERSQKLKKYHVVLTDNNNNNSRSLHKILSRVASCRRHEREPDQTHLMSMSFGKIPWFDDRRVTRRCDWR